MPTTDSFKIRLEDEEGQFLGYACAICEAHGKRVEVLTSGYRGCGMTASGGISKHILAKHKATLERGFILRCKNCGIYLICHEPLRGFDPENCCYFRRSTEQLKRR